MAFRSMRRIVLILRTNCKIIHCTRSPGSHPKKMKIYIGTGVARIVFPALIVLMLTGTGFMLSTRSGQKGKLSRQRFEAVLASLNKKAPYHQKVESTGELSADEPGIAEYHDFLTTFDPATGTVPREQSALLLLLEIPTSQASCYLCHLLRIRYNPSNRR